MTIGPLPGTGPLPVFSGGALPLSQKLSATSTATTITVPAGVKAGDVLVLWDCATNASPSLPAAVVPTGFSAAENITLTADRCILSTKLAAGDEGGTSLTGMDGSAQNSKLLYVFRSAPAVASITVHGSGGQMTTGNPSAQTISDSAGTPPIIAIAGYNAADSTVDPRTFSPAKDGEINVGGGRAYLAYKIYLDSPANITVDMDDEGSRNGLASCWIECAF